VKQNVLKLSVLILLSAVIVYPFLLLLFTSLKSPSELSNNPIGIPNVLHFENYATVFTEAHIPKAFMNSVIIALFSIIGQVLTGSLTAYALTGMNFKKSGLFMGLFLIPMIFSIQTVIVPLFILYKYAGLLNSLSGVVLIYIATGLPMAIFVLSKFMGAIPKQISEAAFIDGANHFQIYGRIMLPLVQPAIVTVVIINGLGIWNDFFVPFMFFTNGQITTLPLSVFQFTQQFGNQWGLISVDIIYCIIPALIVYMALQKHIINGVTAGSVKG
jgi:raffinose/stachyose/melibiose transport system permease protein